MEKTTQRMRPLDEKLRNSLDRRRNQSTLRNLTLAKPDQVDFSSNDFLSLSKDPKLKSRFLIELQKLDGGLASGGSRLLDGNSTYAESLEKEIACFHGAEAGLLFNSGFDANAGFFASVPQPGDVIVYDELVHASVHDGMRLSRASSTRSFPHNSVEGLREVLTRHLQESEKTRKPKHCVIVAVEAIYSMDGDIAPLQEIVDVVHKILGDDRGYLVVDEAHSTGVLGPRGRGLVSELGLEDRVFARLHTFGKSLASNGAIVLGSDILRHYLINYARPLIYTTSLSYPALALVRCSYSLLSSGHTETLQQHVHNLTRAMHKTLENLQTSSPASRQLLNIPSTCPKSSIFSIQLRKPRDLAAFLQGRGMMVRAVVFPTVPLGTERIRLCLHAGNTLEEVERLAQSISEWCETRIRHPENDVGSKSITGARL